MVRQEMYNRYGESAYEDGYAFTPPSPAKCSRPHSRRYVIRAGLRHAPRLSRPGKCAVEMGESAWDNNKITDTLKALPTMVRYCLPQSPAPILRKRRRCGGRVDRRIEYGRRSLGASLRSDTQQGPTPRKVTDVLQTGSKSGFVRLAMHGGWHKCRK